MKPTHIRPTPAVERLAAYGGASQTPLFLPHPERVAKLDWNETTRPPSPVVYRALARFVSRGMLNWYPDTESVELRTRLADYTGAAFEEIQTFCGSDGALEYIARAYLEPGDEVVYAPPTYDNFRVYAESCGAEMVAAVRESCFEPNVDALLTACTGSTRLIYLVNPDNPTGTQYTIDDIRELLHERPDVGIVIDEAYYEYAGETAVPLVREFPNLIVVRSFSKAFALAAFRVGYIVSDPENIATVNRLRVGKNVSALAQVAASAALTDLDYLEEHVADVTRNRERLAELLGGLGLHAQPTNANFVLVRVADPEAVCRGLANSLIFVRNREHVTGMRGYIRITVGDDAITERIVHAFKRLPPETLYGGMRRIARRLTLKRRPERPATTVETDEIVPRREVITKLRDKPNPEVIS